MIAATIVLAGRVLAHGANRTVVVDAHAGLLRRTLRCRLATGLEHYCLEIGDEVRVVASLWAPNDATVVDRLTRVRARRAA